MPSPRLANPPRYWFPMAASALFLCSGLAFIPLLGIQNDEALFASALLPPRREIYAFHIGHLSVPVMLINYLGAFKSWLYSPVVAWLGTGVWAIRFPVVVAGAAGIWMFYSLVRRIAGPRAAILACGLLATDPLYLLTICFDWGPVALQHLLLIAALLLLVQFWQDGPERAATAAFFLFGLALWDKALAIWLLSAMLAAVIVIWPREVRSVLTPRRVRGAILAFLLGSLPLVVYNVKSRGGTLRGTLSTEAANFPQKLYVLRATADGSGLFGSLPEEDSNTPHPHLPRSPLERGSAALAASLDKPRHTLLLWAFLAALLLSPLATGPERRVILFALVTLLIAWMQMAVTARAGTAAHHTILLWPFPQLVIGVSLTAAARRLGRAAVPALTSVGVILMLSGLAVMNEYRVEMVRNGGIPTWSDAIFSLSDYLKTHPARGVFSVDWGTLDSLRLLSRGRLVQGYAAEPLVKPVLSPRDRDALVSMISRPDDLFVSHAGGIEFFPGVNAKLLGFAQAAGFRRENVALISDSFGRPAFEVYRFEATR